MMTSAVRNRRWGSKYAVQKDDVFALGSHTLEPDNPVLQQDILYIHAPYRLSQRFIPQSSACP